jgi:nucleoside-diphosphate-sugar epimerase
LPWHLILTGADGYIGARLAELALAAGWQVTALSRRADGPLRRLPWSLGETLPAEAPAAHALIHLAHDWRVRATEDDPGGINLAGTRTLLHSARAAGVARFVFVSSQSARADAANVYGRLKWRIEQELAGTGEVAARVGLVYGGPRRAMYGLLCKLTEKLPILPMIDPWRPVQPIHLDEVCHGLLRLAAGTQTGWVGLAAPQGLPFGAVLATFARELYGRRLRVVPVPLRLALLACDISAAVPFGPTVDRERVLGLAGTQPMACAAHLRELGVVVQPLAAGLRGESASRRAVLAEGRALLRFVLSARPGSALLRRYARAVAQGGPLPLSPLLRTAPALLRFVEPFGHRSALSQRLALATALAEASPDGARALFRSGWLRLAAEFALDALAVPTRALSSLRR